MGKEVEFLFTVTVGITFWLLLEHEPLVIALFLPVVYRRNCRRPWKIKGSDCASLTEKYFDLYPKQE